MCQNVPMRIESHRDLIVWQKSMDLVDRVYSITRSFPSDERFGLTSQIRRAAISVPSNISEGHSHSSRNDYAQFVSIAKGSIMELETQLVIASRQLYISLDALKPVMSILNEVDRMLTSLRKKLAIRQ